jgi:hypothetical protein
VDAILHRLEAEVVGGAVDLPPFHAAAGQPRGEAVVVVVAAVHLAGVGALLRQLDRRRAAELAAPDDERLVEQAALLEVDEQRADRLIALRSRACGESLRGRRGCPKAAFAMPHLHEPHAAFD